MLRPNRQPNCLLEAVRAAGPTRWWLVAGALVSVAILAVIGFGLQVWNPVLGLMVVAAVFVVVGLMDRDAFTARCAIYQYGELQAARIGPTFPINAADTDAWLADPSHATETVARAFVLFNATRLDDALAEVDGATLSNPTDQATAERLRLSVQRSRGDAIDPGRFLALLDALPSDEQRWQHLSLAVMELSGDVADRLPWRDRFVAAVRDLGPWRLPRRAWFVIVTQQFTMAITFGLLALVMLGVATQW